MNKAFIIIFLFLGACMGCLSSVQTKMEQVHLKRFKYRLDYWFNKCHLVADNSYFWILTDVVCQRVQWPIVRISSCVNICLCGNIIYTHWTFNLQIGIPSNVSNLQKFHSRWINRGSGVGLFHEVPGPNRRNHHIINCHRFFRCWGVSNCSWVGCWMHLPNWSSDFNRFHFLVQCFTGIKWFFKLYQHSKLFETVL